MKKQSDSPDINPRSTNFCEFLMSYFVVKKITEEQVSTFSKLSLEDSVTVTK